MTAPAETVDAVVIGAGPNGLVAANTLADAGWEVLVLEAATTPGGAVRTAGLIEPGFRNDLFSAFCPLGAASPVLRDLGLEQHGLRWVHAPAVLAHVLPDDRCAVLSRDLDDTAASLESFASGDGDAWRAEFAGWTRVRDDLLTTLFTAFPPVRAGLRLARTLGVADGLRLARMLTMPARTFGDDVPTDPFLLLGQMTTADALPRRHRVRVGLHPRATWTPLDVRRDPPLRRPHRAGRRTPRTGFHRDHPRPPRRGTDDLHHQDHNLVGGAINAGTSAIHQQLFFRPLPGLGRADTPIDCLYPAGASAHPGVAVHGGSVARSTPGRFAPCTPRSTRESHRSARSPGEPERLVRDTSTHILLPRVTVTRRYPTKGVTVTSPVPKPRCLPPPRTRSASC
jgi:phytoene dehydrogenase-like protein